MVLSIRGISRFLARPQPACSVRRQLHLQSRHQTQAAVKPSSPRSICNPVSSTNPALTFPCLDERDTRTSKLSESGPEPSYTTGSHLSFCSVEPLLLDWGGRLTSYDLAYETWGTLNKDHSNAILLHTGLSASSHAKSSKTNPKPGWWEQFIGPGAPLDTSKYFIICTNVIGGCYGSTGPSSIDPANGEHYATRFPILTVPDIVRAQFRLLDALGIQRLYASVGASMGGMQSLAAGVGWPNRVGRVVSISGCARSHPFGIAMRHTQRQVLMMDPNWSRGFYYNSIPPHAGMKLAREIATVTYRSGPEWEQRFGRRRADPSKPPALCPDFLIETYLDHSGEKWCLEFDANSMLYISKAMDLFDLGKENMPLVDVSSKNKNKNGRVVDGGGLVVPESPYKELSSSPKAASMISSKDDDHRDDLIAGLAPIKNTPTLVLGVASDVLFPAWQQREIAEALELAGNSKVVHRELGLEKSIFGHDTFLLDLEHVGGEVGRFLASG